MSDEVAAPVDRPSSVSITRDVRRVIGHDVRRERQIGAENAREQAMRSADELALLIYTLGTRRDLHIEMGCQRAGA